MKGFQRVLKSVFTFAYVILWYTCVLLDSKFELDIVLFCDNLFRLGHVLNLGVIHA